MKNIFIIFLFSLFLSGCFKDKAEVAIENCADEKINYISASNKILVNELKKDKRYVILEKENQTHQQNHQEAVVKFQKFVKDNFRNSDYLIKYYEPYLYGVSDILEHPTLFAYKNIKATNSDYNSFYNVFLFYWDDVTRRINSRFICNSVRNT
jgi:hypothetical protein